MDRNITCKGKEQNSEGGVTLRSTLQLAKVSDQRIDRNGNVGHRKVLLVVVVIVQTLSIWVK